MKILLTGYSGFTGRHFQRQHSCAPLADRAGKLIDLLDRDLVNSTIADIQPEAVVHLAAQTFVPDSFADPHGTMDVNVTGTLNLLMALEACGFKGRLLFVSSAEVYGLVPPEALPLKETCQFRPRSPYAASKVAAEALVFQYSQTSQFEAIIARPFNQLGSGQQESFAISNFAKQAIQINLGRQPPKLKVGDIDVTRDFTDIRDTVRAYLLLLEHGQNGEAYNVCSGQERAIRSMLEKILAASKVEAEIVKDTARLRPSEQRRVAGDFEKLHSACGWRPEIEIDQTITDILEDWRERLA
jgi:GDP-4-dehydro-6-deoxy-D-mannose reductase